MISFRTGYQRRDEVVNTRKVESLIIPLEISSRQAGSYGLC